MAKTIVNMGASVRARLLVIAKGRGQTFDLILTRYAIERLLYRLGTSRFRDRFVLKGAMLMTTWFDVPFRPTRDLDLLGYGDPEAEGMVEIFAELCAIDANDGVVFDGKGLIVDRIREELEYGGLRLRTNAVIGGATVRVSIDIGFGDATEPGLEELDYPVLLDNPAPHLRAYSRETVIAEKFQAMVLLGRANSRMKDFYDIWLLAKTHRFEDDRLARAIAATFERRRTTIPVDIPDALTESFASDPAKQQQWSAFARSLEEEVPPLARIIAEAAEFLMPHAARARLSG
ncbi:MULTISPECIES: nucleotidyl transferase AbiEii/AbiGii toxin family protein [unclassified Mesorhizobium]|uniref:nucleotidyl transferase AbiEii/AbiGii toxin family protein n=1 Tax=unclassified Mesorhizobium TaxID=325217 RepID=UPI001CCB5E25|nr:MULTISPECIES: nucleotidyl transferase AbiEii/AbiGii toxin family protein [unclassified Mesorhizobium]MBZ9916591.1 nucleotidyl transferase AbiEii/AbiGii toxin family protein [Mesorhizobium sp. BR1-1-7]MBZ9952882.1 nucleotidyl transferase AbiEii/AbiGii toxin family protein [Mesorhizobium sp. BR1-1-15]MBZ9972591.1 nucleotidyl transferase AbiEii/AbiGii toxin family protein [Mesorhizobium sp. BR1-1-12]